MKEDYFRKSELYEDLYYITKGREKCVPNHGYGPITRDYFLVHIILNGKGFYRNHETKFMLGKGQYFMIFPGENAYYEADSEDPWEYIWFGFDGEAAKNILDIIGVTPDLPVGTIKSFSDILPQLEEMIEMDHVSTLSRLRLQGKLFEVFSLLAKEEHIKKEKTVSIVTKQIIYSETAMRIIRNNYSNPDFLIRNVAEEMSLNPSYLASVFKEVTGNTLNEYIIAFRIQKSRAYLETTDFSIGAIAEEVGYKSSVSFRRAFKSVMNMTPKAYKESQRDR